ncbi:hypothetical protein BVX94_02270 [bacterium B17]|nr:hypothetical protein BVX94_02270 [bacterium B17]
MNLITDGQIPAKAKVYIHPYYSVVKMLKNDKSLEERLGLIAGSLKEVLQKVDEANAKLDHLIETYRNDRYTYGTSTPYASLP